MTKDEFALLVSAVFVGVGLGMILLAGLLEFSYE